MKTYDSATTGANLIDYYCFRCKIGLYDCKIHFTECPRINTDKDFEKIMELEKYKEAK